MFRSHLICWISFCIMCTPFWCEAGPSVRGPKAALDESVFEFQPVLEGSPIVHEFMLQNRGDESLEIIKIESG